VPGTDEGRLAERALLGSVLDALPDVALCLDPDGAILSFNTQAEQICDTTREEAAGRNFLEVFLLPQGRAAFAAALKTIMAGAPARAFECPVQSASGDIRSLSWRMDRLMGIAGEPGGILAVGRAINHHRRAAGARRKKETRFRVLFETMDQGVVYQNGAGKITALNPAAERILGLTRDQALGRDSGDSRWRAVRADGSPYRPEDHPSMVALRTGRPVKDVVMGIYHPIDGEERWLLINAMPHFREGEARPYEVYTTFNDITHRRRMEQALRESEERFRSIVQSSPMGIHMYRIDPEGELIFQGANPAADRILGVDNRQFIGKTLEEAFPPLADTEVPKRYRLVCRDGKPWDAEHVDYEDERIRGAYEIHAFQTSPGSMATLFVDITEHKQAEEKLKASRRRFRSLIQDAPVPIVIHCQERMVFLNPAAVAAFGGKEDGDLLGRSIWDVIHSDFRSQAAERVHLAYNCQRAPEPVEGRFVKLDGTPMDVLVLTSPIDYDGLAASQVVFTDLTEQKQAERLLAQQLAEMTAINALSRGISPRLSPDDVARASLEGLRGPVAPDLAVLFLRRGHDLQILASHAPDPPYRYSRKPIRHVSECLCGQALSTGQAIYVRDLQLDDRCIGSELRSFAALPLYRGDRIIGLLGLGSAAERDFSAQAVLLETLAAEIALGLQNALLFEQVRQHGAELEKRVAERTAELEAINTELEAFSYSVSHDLRSPLRHISGFAQILREDHAGNLSEEALDLLEQVRQGAVRMGVLIEHLLRLSRLGRQVLDRTLVSNKQLIKEVWAELSSEHDLARVRFDLHPLPEVWADRGLLRQVWFNLLDNAIKYSAPRETPEIAVDAHEEAGQTWLRVRDNGVGFAPDHADKLFAVFQRLHTDREFPGTGVGLAIAQRIVRRHGGQIRGRGAVHDGAVFEFVLGKEIDS